MLKPARSEIQNLYIPSEAMRQWHDIVEDYSRRALTNKEDKLPAISGLTSLVQGATGFKYLAGMWEEDIRSDLVWRRSPRESWLAINPVPQSKLQTPSSLYLAPTWSCASTDEPITFWETTPGVQDGVLIGAHTSTQGSKGFGQVTGGSIKLHAWGKPATYCPSPNVNIWRIDIFIRAELKIPQRFKIGRGLKKEIQIKVGDAILDDLAAEKSSGSCMLIRIAECQD